MWSPGRITRHKWTLADLRPVRSPEIVSGQQVQKSVRVIGSDPEWWHTLAESCQGADNFGPTV